MSPEPSTRCCRGQVPDGVEGSSGYAARAAEGKRARARRTRPWSSIGVCCCLGLAATTGCQQQAHAFVMPQPRGRVDGSQGGSTALRVAQVGFVCCLC